VRAVVQAVAVASLRTSFPLSLEEELMQDLNINNTIQVMNHCLMFSFSD